MNIFLQLTYSGLFLAVLAQQVGLPIPSVVFLMAAGALCGTWSNEPCDYSFVECCGLPGRRWDMVLDWPQVGF